jgi:hypothetical protein
VNLIGFVFGGPSLYHKWKLRLTVDMDSNGEIKITIPPFIPAEVIKAPPKTITVECRIATCVADVKQLSELERKYEKLIFNYNRKPVEGQTVSIKPSISNGCLVVTAISLVYILAFTGHQQENKDEDFMPVEIVAARYFG